MKNISLKVLAFLFVALSLNLNAQNEDNPWAISVGVSAIDFYPVGNHDGDQFFSGDNFEDFFSVKDHWNISPTVSYVSFGRYLKNNLSLTFTGTVNNIEKYGSESVDNLSYYNLSGRFTYSLAELFNTNKLEPFLGIGGGYSWLDEGPFNSNGYVDSSTLNGIGSFNTTFGLSYWVSDFIGFTLQSTYNYIMPKDTNIVQQHFTHSAGLSVRFGGKDTDGDGIYDKNDACPDVAGLETFNGCPDTDGDGVQDSEDSCPEIVGIPDYAGCPDSDGDGVSDNKDRCPDVSGIESMGGCPDSDGDGITDAKDNCPDTVGVRGNRGCPWPDTDGDSVLDKDDKCPDEAGPASNGGCPEIEKILSSYAKTINFDYGKSAIKDEVVEALQGIVALIKEYPNAEFVVEGHTDSIGSESFNQTLSEERAASIVAFLVSNGIDTARLTAVGFGETSPISEDSTKEGMAQNRRVEIKLAN